jgi:hypothetical protein
MVEPDCIVSLYVKYDRNLVIVCHFRLLSYLVTTCGHAIHMDCWDMVYSASYSRVMNGARSAESFSLDIQKGECLCPLCKSVSNVVLPLVDQLSYSANSMINFEADSDEDSTESNPSPTCAVNEVSTSLSPHEVFAMANDFTKLHQSLTERVCRLRVKRNIRMMDMRFHSNISTQFDSLSVVSAEKKAAGFDRLSLSDFDSWFNGNMGSLRSFHATCSSVAYSLVSLSSRHLRTSSDKSVDQTNLLSAYVAWKLSDSDNSFARALLGLVSRSMSIFSKKVAILDKLLVHPFFSLLLGIDRSLKSNSPLVQQICQSMRSLPFHAVHSSVLPDSSTLLNGLQKAVQQCGEGVLTSELWGFSHNPILTQDLSILVLMAVTMYPRDRQSELQLSMMLLVLAKIAQSLLEPRCTGVLSQCGCHEQDRDCDSQSSKRARLSPSSELGENTGTALRRWQVLLCKQANTPLFVDVIDERELSLLVADSILPFLELLCRIFDWQDLPMRYHSFCEARGMLVSATQSVLTTDTEQFTPSNTLLDVTTLYLRALDISSVSELVQSELAQQLGSHWGLELRGYYSSCEEGRETRWAPVPMEESEDVCVAQSNLDKCDQMYHDAISFEDFEQEQSRAENNDNDLDFENDDGEYHDAVDLGMFGEEWGQNGGVVGGEGDEVEDEDEDEVEEEVLDNDQGMDVDAGIDVDVDGAHVPENDDEPAVGDDELMQTPRVQQWLQAFRHVLRNNEGGINIPDSELFAHLREAFGPQLNRLAAALGTQRPTVEPADVLNANAPNSVAATTTPANSSGRPTSTAAVAPAWTVNDWKLYGELPVNPLVNEVSTEDYESLSDVVIRQPTPLQGSLTGTFPVFSLQGNRLPYFFPDWSQMSITFSELRQNCLIPLPTVYTDIYHETKFPEGPLGVTVDDPTLCLVCGAVLNGGMLKCVVTADQVSKSDKSAVLFFVSGRRPNIGSDGPRNPGECCLHSERCGAGIGVFFLVQHCQVLFMRGGRAIYFPSIYLDELGETSETNIQNKPMYLSLKRYRKIEEMYVMHQIAREVVTKRVTADSVIRQFWH